MQLEDMKVGGLYKLKETVENEHQDHLFTYPAGLIVRLDYISEETEFYNERRIDTEDGTIYDADTRKIKVCHFDIPTCGMCYVFSPDNLEPATEEELAASKLEVTYYQCNDPWR